MKAVFFKKTDILIVLTLLLVGGGIWLTRKATMREENVVAQIFHNRTLVASIDLSKAKDTVFALPNNDHVLFRTTGDGGIRFENSDCPDKICINSGTLYLSGETAACIPNGLVLKLISQNQDHDDGLDIVIG